MHQNACFLILDDLFYTINYYQCVVLPVLQRKTLRGVTMVGTAQTGLGAGTVAMSLKVFMVVMFYTHERLGICTAQPMIPDSLQDSLPDPLPGFLPQMKNHFCSKGKYMKQCEENFDVCGNSSKKLCEQICSADCPDTCWNTPQDTAPDCRMNQNRICGYSDATVCQHRDGRGTCVYRTGRSLTFCVCRNQEISYTRCMQTDTNVEAIVLGSLFALLLLVIIGAVIFYLRRQGRHPFFVRRASKPAKSSSVQLEARDATRANLPVPPVPGSSLEYSYACDHRPAKPGAKEDPNQDDHTYYSVGEGGFREGNPRYVSDVQRKMPAIKELDTATDNAKDHPYFVLNRDDEDDEPINESGGEHTGKVDVTDSSTGVESKEVNDEDYIPLVPTGDPTSQTEQSGDEVAVAPTSFKVTSPIESRTEGLSNGDDGTYFPLIQTAEPKSHVEQSGYEVAKIPTPESHDATPPTGAQSKSGDDDTYTALVRTAEPKSQKEHSGYEAAIIPIPGLADDSDVTSLYDHLNRKEENDSKEGALSTVDVDDYQH